MKSILYWIDEYLEIVIGSVFLVLMVLFTFLQIIGRYVFPTPLPWTEEMTRYMFVWMTYIALGYAVKMDKHIRILFFRNLFKAKIRLLFDIFSDLVFIVFSYIVTIYSYEMMMTIKQGGQTAISLEFVPMWVLYLVMPVGFFILILRLIQHIIKCIKQMKNCSSEKMVKEV